MTLVNATGLITAGCEICEKNDGSESLSFTDMTNFVIFF